MMTTEGDEVETTALLIADQALRHANIVHPRSQKRDLGHPFFLDWTDVGHPPIMMRTSDSAHQSLFADGEGPGILHQGGFRGLHYAIGWGRGLISARPA